MVKKGMLRSCATPMKQVSTAGFALLEEDSIEILKLTWSACDRSKSGQPLPTPLQNNSPRWRSHTNTVLRSPSWSNEARAASAAGRDVDVFDLDGVSRQ